MGAANYAEYDTHWTTAANASILLHHCCYPAIAVILLLILLLVFRFVVNKYPVANWGVTEVILLLITIHFVAATLTHL